MSRTKTAEWSLSASWRSCDCRLRWSKPRQAAVTASSVRVLMLKPDSISAVVVLRSGSVASFSGVLPGGPCNCSFLRFCVSWFKREYSSKSLTCKIKSTVGYK